MTGLIPNTNGNLDLAEGYELRKDSTGVYVVKSKTKEEILQEALIYKYNDIITRRDPTTNKHIRYITLDDTQYCVFQLAECFTFITAIETDTIFVYNAAKGIYETNGETIVKIFLEKYLREFCKTTFVSEVLNKIRRKTYENIKIFVENDKNFLCLLNGVWSFEERSLLPYDPKYHFINRLSVNYVPGVTCEKISKFFNGIVEESNVETLYEIVGFCLMPEYRIQKAVLLVGSGRNGKSVFLNLLKTFLGKDNVSCESIQHLSKDKFSTFQLFGKIANIFPDLSADEIEDSSTFKTLTSGLDSVSGEQKFKDKFSFINHAKLLFSCNQIPRTSDISDAFFRRWVIVTFPRKFEGVDDNKNLINEIVTSDELSGLFNIALEYYYKLLSHGDIGSQSVDDIREIYTRLSDPVGSFILDNIVICGDDFIPKEDLFEKFASYCRVHKFPVMSEKMFSAIIFQKLPVTNFRASTDDGRRPMCWKGIGFKVLEEGVDVTKDVF